LDQIWSADIWSRPEQLSDWIRDNQYRTWIRSDQPISDQGLNSLVIGSGITNIELDQIWSADIWSRPEQLSDWIRDNQYRTWIRSDQPISDQGLNSLVIGSGITNIELGSDLISRYLIKAWTA
jgi:hypothetical protein